MMADVRWLSFPRATGSDGERRARRMVVERLASLGYGVSVEDFRFDPRPLRWGLPVLLVGGALLLVRAALSPRPLPFVLLTVGLLLPIFWITRRFAAFGRHSGRMQSANVVAMPDSSGRGPRVFVVAHLDTKSQRLSFATRAVLAGAALSLTVALAGLLFLLPNVPIVPAVVGLAAAAALIALALAGYGNRSPGALDNASGLAVLLEVARRLGRDPVSGLEVAYLVTGAEEDGLVGATRFVERHRRGLRVAEDFFLNLDTVGGAGQLIVAGHAFWWPIRAVRRLVELLREEARRLGFSVRLRHVPLPGGVDSFVPSSRGLPAVTLASGGIGSTYRHVHRPSDSPERIDPSNLVRSAELVERVIRRLAAERPGGRA